MCLGQLNPSRTWLPRTSNTVIVMSSPIITVSVGRRVKISILLYSLVRSTQTAHWRRERHALSELSGGVRFRRHSLQPSIRVHICPVANLAIAARIAMLVQVELIERLDGFAGAAGFHAASL